jgi:integrase
MAERLRAIEGPTGTLAFTTITGKRLNRSNLYRDVLHPAAVRAGVPWVSFHNFRHTCASLLFAAGKNVKQVQVWLGHADPGFTVRTYIHLMDEGLGDADFLDDVVGDRRTIQ